MYVYCIYLVRTRFLHIFLVYKQFFTYIPSTRCLEKCTIFSNKLDLGFFEKRFLINKNPLSLFFHCTILPSTISLLHHFTVFSSNPCFLRGYPWFLRQCPVIPGVLLAVQRVVHREGGGVGFCLCIQESSTALLVVLPGRAV